MREEPSPLWYVLVLLLAALAIQQYLARVRTEAISYDQFEAALAADDIAEATVTDTTIEGTYKRPRNDGRPQRFTTGRVAPELAKALGEAKVTYRGESGPGALQLVLGWLIPMLVLFGLWTFFSSRAAERGGMGLMTVGKSKAKLFLEKSIVTTFADVAGVDEAKEELQEVIAFLKDPQGHGRLGAHVPKGVLLVGPLRLNRKPQAPVFSQKFGAILHK